MKPVETIVLDNVGRDVDVGLQNLTCDHLYRYFTQEGSKASNAQVHIDEAKSWDSFIKKVAGDSWTTIPYVSLERGTFELSTFKGSGQEEEAYNPMFVLPFYKGRNRVFARHLSFESIAKTFEETVIGEYLFEFLSDVRQELIGFIVLKNTEIVWHNIHTALVREYAQRLDRPSELKDLWK